MVYGLKKWQVLPGSGPCRDMDTGWPFVLRACGHLQGCSQNSSWSCPGSLANKNILSSIDFFAGIDTTCFTRANTLWSVLMKANFTALNQIKCLKWSHHSKHAGPIVWDRNLRINIIQIPLEVFTSQLLSKLLALRHISKGLLGTRIKSDSSTLLY